MSFNNEVKKVVTKQMEGIKDEIENLKKENMRLNQELNKLRSKDVPQRVKLTLKAVCECGFIIENLELRKYEQPIINADWEENRYVKMMHPINYFYPTHCPKCGGEIASIECRKNLIERIKKQT